MAEIIDVIKDLHLEAEVLHDEVLFHVLEHLGACELKDCDQDY